jgi:hypothetical protein
MQIAEGSEFSLIFLPDLAAVFESRYFIYVKQIAMSRELQAYC